MAQKKQDQGYQKVCHDSKLCIKLEKKIECIKKNLKFPCSRVEGSCPMATSLPLGNAKVDIYFQWKEGGRAIILTPSPIIKCYRYVPKYVRKV